MSTDQPSEEAFMGQELFSGLNFWTGQFAGCLRITVYKVSGYALHGTYLSGYPIQDTKSELYIDFNVKIQQYSALAS